MTGLVVDTLGESSGSRVVILGPILTMAPLRPHAEGIVLANGRVQGFVAGEDRPDAPVVRLPPGAVVVPGFIDPHVHLLGMAARRLGLDVTDGDATMLVERVGAALGALREGEWLRVYGFDEAIAGESRRPSRAELDAVSPRHPVVVRHRAGYEALLNSAALAALGAPDVDADWLPASHELVGAIPAIDRDELGRALAGVFAALPAVGITSVVDATVENDAEAIGIVASRLGAVRVAMMPGIGAVGEIAASGLSYGDRVDSVALRHAKITPPTAGGVDVAEAVGLARALRWPVAIHAIDVDEVAEATAALGSDRPFSDAGRPERPGDRIEHCGLSLPDQIEDVARTGAAVVTQPGFLTSRAVKYRQELSDVEQEWIYRVASLRRAGVLVAASSDAPVIAADPLEAMLAARTRGGDPLTTRERVDAATALRMVTVDAALAADIAGGVLSRGGPADLVVLSADPLGPTRPDVLATVVGGRVVHSVEGVLG